jgi:hypothetical protein
VLQKILALIEVVQVWLMQIAGEKFFIDVRDKNYFEVYLQNRNDG